MWRKPPEKHTTKILKAEMGPPIQIQKELKPALKGQDPDLGISGAHQKVDSSTPVGPGVPLKKVWGDGLQSGVYEAVGVQ